MKIHQISECSSCKTKNPGYTMMKKDKTHSGKMDTQLFPEAENTKFDRNIVKKNREKKSHSFNLSEFKKISSIFGPEAYEYYGSDNFKNSFGEEIQTGIIIDNKPVSIQLSLSGDEPTVLILLDNQVEAIYTDGDGIKVVSTKNLEKFQPYLQDLENKAKTLFGGTKQSSSIKKNIVKSNIKHKNIHAQMNDVLKLESEDEDYASDMLSQIVNKAIQGDVKQQQFLSDLWDGENWDSILKKVQTEGSVWYVWWMDGVRKLLSQLDTDDAEFPQPDSSAKSINRTIEAKKKKKKKKKWDPNPWAVCHTTVNKDKNPEKYERCVMKVKKQQAFNLNKFLKNANLEHLSTEIQTLWSDSQIVQAIKALGEENIAGFRGVAEADVVSILVMAEEYELIDIKNWLSMNVGGSNKKQNKTAQGNHGNEISSFAPTETKKQKCLYCNKPTVAESELCDTCWSIQGYFENPEITSDKAYIKRLTELKDPKLVEKIRQIVKRKTKNNNS